MIGAGVPVGLLEVTQGQLFCNNIIVIFFMNHSVLEFFQIYVFLCLWLLTVGGME